MPFIGAPPVWGNTLGLARAARRAPASASASSTPASTICTPTSAAPGCWPTTRRTIAPSRPMPTIRAPRSSAAWTSPATTTTAPPATIAADPDPMDCNGHGSHVAGTAAGFGVNADGTTYAGPYGPSTPFSSLRIGPGIGAAGAALRAARLRLRRRHQPDRAGDRLGDGSERRQRHVRSPRRDQHVARLVARLAHQHEHDCRRKRRRAGIIVVASAGNNGDTYFVNGSPGVSSAHDLGGGVASTPASARSSLRVNTPGRHRRLQDDAVSPSFGGQRTGRRHHRATSSQALDAGRRRRTD